MLPPMKPFAMLSLILLLVCAGAARAAVELEYPKSFSRDGYELRVHHPVIDRWDAYETIEGWLPVEVREIAGGRDWVGAVRARAATAVDLERRLVRLSHQQVLEVRFTAPEVPAAVQAVARRVIRGEPQTVLLDEALSMLAEDFDLPAQGSVAGDFNRRPPRIVVSATPLGLLLIDQEPVPAPIDGTTLEVVVNTDWNLFRDTQSGRWWVINEGSWQTHTMLASGGWTTTDEVPAAFRELAVGDRWETVRAALPAKLPEREPTPFLVSLEATELVVIDGAPRLGGIPEAGALQEVVNTDADLFALHGRWYLLAAGRWFSAPELDGRWQSVEAMPAEFSAIPPTHRRAPVRASVPGTVEARMALMEATLPRYTELPADAEPGATVPYVGPPRFEPIPNTRVARAVNTPFAVIRHNNFHYLCHEAAWYLSRDPEGPWRVALSVPEEIYAIPPSDPLHYVTYLRPVRPPAEESEPRVRFSYNGGYEGAYATGGVVVQGTGWSYDPWIAYPGGRPVYWGHPWTYGRPHAGYGGYFHPLGVYGPWWGTQSVTLSGPGRGAGGAAAPSEQDPRKARRGYDYATPEQERWAAGSLSADDDLYAGPNGEVYQRSGDGWSQHTGDGWSTMAELERQYGVQATEPVPQEARQRQAYRQNPEDVERMERYYERRSRNYHVYSSVYVRR